MSNMSSPDKQQSAGVEPPGPTRWAAPTALWSVNRLDISVKILYTLEYLGRPLPLPHAVDIQALYRRHIQLRTGGREPGNPFKQTVDDYERDFQLLIGAITREGFQSCGAVPLNPDGLILNAAHRLSCALAIGLEQIPCFEIKDVQAYDWNISWFLGHRFCASEVSALLHTWAVVNASNARLLMLETDNQETAASVTGALFRTQKVLAWRKLDGVLGEGGHRTGRLIYMEKNSQLDAYLVLLRARHPCMQAWYRDGAAAGQLSFEVLSQQPG